MKTYRGRGVKLRAFLSSALDGMSGQLQAPSALSDTVFP